MNPEPYNPEKKPLFYLLSRFWFRLGLKIWNRFQAVGGNNMPAQGGVIIASNHASFMDPPIVGCGLMHRYVRFMARNSLFQNRVAKWWADNIGVVSIDRNRGDIAAFKAALAVLRDGGALCLFPEGTRTLDGNLQKPKAGIGFLIIKSELPVLPVYVEGSFKALHKGAKWIRPARITARYGSLIAPDEFQHLGSGRDAYDKATELVMERIADLRRLNKKYDNH